MDLETKIKELEEEINEIESLLAKSINVAHRKENGQLSPNLGDLTKVLSEKLQKREQCKDLANSPN